MLRLFKAHFSGTPESFTYTGTRHRECKTVSSLLSSTTRLTSPLRNNQCNDINNDARRKCYPPRTNHFAHSDGSGTTPALRCLETIGATDSSDGADEIRRDGNSTLYPVSLLVFAKGTTALLFSFLYLYARNAKEMR